MVPSLNKSDIITLEQYQQCELSSYFEVDLVNVYKNGKPNPSHVYETFGKFSSHTSDEVRLLTLQAIAANVDFYRNRSTVCLGMRENHFDNWLTDIANSKKLCDELGIMSLSYLYRRHTMVYTSSRIWTTISKMQANLV